MDKKYKQIFEQKFKEFARSLSTYVNDGANEWTIKGFIDAYRNVYSISGDTKIISKILEIHLFPQILQFARDNKYKLVLASSQNYYPDISLVDEVDDSMRFAVDIKTSYRKNDNQCNGFTLGSHGGYFLNRQQTKNIQFPYASYLGHYCLCILYDRINQEEFPCSVVPLNELSSIVSVIKNIQIFAVEKWKIASDKEGSGNTANIGSIKDIDSLISEKGPFVPLGEKWFDDYWMNYDKIVIQTENGALKHIRSLREFVEYRGGTFETGERNENV